MVLFRTATCFAVVIVLAIGSGSEAAKKKKRSHGLRGSVIDVVAGKQGGTLNVKIVRKKKGAAVVQKEMRIRVDNQTKIKRVVGKKKDRKVQAASFSDLQVGQAVAIVLRAGSADEAAKVIIGARNKKKKAG